MLTQSCWQTLKATYSLELLISWTTHELCFFTSTVNNTEQEKGGSDLHLKIKKNKYRVQGLKWNDKTSENKIMHLKAWLEVQNKDVAMQKCKKKKDAEFSTITKLTSWKILRFQHARLDICERQLDFSCENHKVHLITQIFD